MALLHRRHDRLRRIGRRVIAFTHGFDQAGFVATRNRLIHGYLGIDNDTLWSIVEQDTPALLALLAALKSHIGRLRE
ncbi:MAG: DUF86 domain-containing protein [Sulfuritalea sp.]|nr:DUF86 domain-containing protein [Sulfuritalea sp.]